MDQGFVEDRPRLDARGHLGGDAGIAGQRPQHRGRADLTVHDASVGGCEVGREAAVEPDLQGHPGGLHGFDGPVGIVEREGHRLLTEHVFARACRGDDEVGVAGGGGRDDDCVNRRIREQLQRILVAAWGRKPFCCAGYRIGNGHQAGVGQPLGERLGVKTADPPGTDEPEGQR